MFGLLLLVVHGIVDMQVLVTFRTFNGRLAKPQAIEASPHRPLWKQQHTLNPVSAKETFQSLRLGPQRDLSREFPEMRIMRFGQNVQENGDYLPSQWFPGSCKPIG